MLKKMVLLFLSFYLVPADEDNSEECITRELTSSYITVPAKVSSWSSTSGILDLYHCNRFPRHVKHMFMDVYVQINLTNEHAYQLYQGENCSEVLQHYHDDQRFWGLVRRVKLLRYKQLNPFSKTVIGVSTRHPYEIRIRIWKINYIRVAVFIGGIVLFLMAYSLVKNAIFYYTSGCTIGVLASLLIVGFVVYRLTPRSWLGIPLMFTGWSVSFFFIYTVWKNLASLILLYQKFVAAYFATVILVSLAVCYRYGPPTDVRSHNLAQWTLQLIALLLIYSSCQTTDIAIGVIALLLLWSVSKNWLINIASRFMSVFKAVWLFLFPQCQRLLTIEEYRQQGEEETRKALEELRRYCRSPEADVWKITSSVSDPKRLASFVDGICDHVREDESRLHDLECTDFDDISDDSGEDEYVVAQRSYLSNKHESPRKRYQVGASSSSYMQSVDRRLNPRQREKFTSHEDFDGDENEFRYNWQTHSLPLENSYRKSQHQRNLCNNGRITNNTFHSLRHRENFQRSIRSPPNMDFDEVVLSP
uniref:Nuclear envelope integral membrane protein 1 n=1 Tax=Wuchereria bancrofti TaxID=6293 RepID=A0AAF5PRY9_WUCBA